MKKFIKRKEKNEGKNIELGLHTITEVYEEEITESKTKYIIGGVRSGQKLSSDGSLVIVGDVNAGAEIIAKENIIVLGTLRGVAHAGAKGNRKTIIAAQKIASPQLRIANILWENNVIKGIDNTIDEDRINCYAKIEKDLININKY